MPDIKTAVTVITAPERINHYNAHYAFRRPLNDAILQDVPLVVADLNQVERMDSLAIGILVGAQRLCTERGTRFGVACSSETVLRVFRRMALGGFFDVRDSAGAFTEAPATCSNCGGTPTVASIGKKRYCRVDAGFRLAAGEPVDYDDNPADGESSRTGTDCRGSGWHDCPCETDGPDGLCSCCRSGEQNGSCGNPAPAAVTAGTCEACSHLRSLHGPGGCTAKVFPAHSLTGEPCPCEHPMETVTAGEDQDRDQG